MQDVSCEPRMLWLSGNPSSKLGYFQAATPSTLSRLCFHRKAINKDKHPSCGFLFYHGLDGFSGFAVEESDQKVSVGL